MIESPICHMYDSIEKARYVSINHQNHQSTTLSSPPYQLSAPLLGPPDRTAIRGARRSGCGRAPVGLSIPTDLPCTAGIYTIIYMEVSINGGTRIDLSRKIPFKWMIWGYPYFREPPYGGFPGHRGTPKSS